MCQRPALHFVTSKEARSGTISTSDANDPMAIISMLFLFVKQSAFICRTFIKNGSGRGRNGCTKFLPRLSSYSPRHSPHAESGNVLLSQVVSNQVPSALKGLTSVFGMGTGGSLSPLSPEIV